MSKVTLRTKSLKGGRQRLYLDIYPPIPHPDTGKPSRREMLKQFIYEKPKTIEEREHNKRAKRIAEHIRAKRQLDIDAGNYDFLAKFSGNENFLNWLKQKVEHRKEIDRNYQSWRSTFLYLYRFTDGQLPIKKLTRGFCESFREYFQTTHCLNSRRSLSRNSAASYFDVFKEAIYLAREEGVLKENPVEFVKSISYVQPDRAFLTFEELQAAAKAACEDPVLKRAALFSALTGLRFGDIESLKWEQVRHTKKEGYFIRKEIQKASRYATVYISDQAHSLLGERTVDSDRPFDGLKYGNRTTTDIKNWLSQAGINRHVTFHAFRHTYATLQISQGTDIYTLRDLLSQKNVQTTQIYARVLDKKKREAIDRLPDLDLEMD